MKKEYCAPEFDLVQLIFIDDLMDLTWHSRTESGGTDGDLIGNDDIDLG